MFDHLTGTAATYMRFFPYVKRNYDYGVLIFLLTFNLITVSSYRVSNILKIAHERLYTIVIGCGVCLLMTLFIFPIWSGEDLHNSTAAKLEGLAKSIRGIHASSISSCHHISRFFISFLLPRASNEIFLSLYRNLAACVDEYFSDVEKEMTREKSSEDPIDKGYKAVLDSKSQDETLVSKLVSYVYVISSKLLASWSCY